MKKLFMMLFVASSGIVIAQNQISTPVGQNLRVATDTMIVNGKVKINGGNLSTLVGQTLKVATDTLVVNGQLNVKGGALYLNGRRSLVSIGTRNTFGGLSGNFTNTGTSNTFFGAEVGQVVTTGWGNTFFGSRSGRYNTTGDNNTFVGLRSGESNVGGLHNTFMGQSAGQQNTSGNYNVFIGSEAGSLVTTGTRNVYVGNLASYYNPTGNNNVAIGFNAGPTVNLSSGSGNVYIGYNAGNTDTGNNHLYIANTNTTTPLILGDFSTGKLGFSTANSPTSITASPIGGGTPVTVNTSAYRLFVKGGILTEALTVAGGWADYVFEKGYRLKPLSEVETFIAENGHLPNVPSARQIENGGINVGDIARIQQEKIEELTLYVIELEKSNKAQELANKANEFKLTEQQQELKDLRRMMTESMKRSN